MIDLDGLENLIEGIVKRAAVFKEPGDYTGDDGLVYCGKCNTPREHMVELFGEERKVGCLCKCRYDQMKKDELEDQKRQEIEKIKQLRISGIQDVSLRECRFENADMTKFLSKCRDYCGKWDEMLKDNIGLLFWGDTGTGKTFSAACIANYLIDRNVPVLMTSFPKILNAGYDKAEIATQMRRFKLVIIDDLGTERQSDYAMETVYMVIDERYKSGLPLIVTTNLQLEDIKNPKNMAFKRIYERVLEMCLPMGQKGGAYRKKKAEEKLLRAREILSVGDTED